MSVNLLGFSVEYVVNFGVFLVLFIWLGVMNWQLWQMKKHYRELTKDVKKQDLQTVLNTIIKNFKLQEKQIEHLRGNLKSLESDAQFHIQRIGFVRFNPFSETGGNQSFILSLLDEKDNGIVLSSLHSRDVTRLYAKQIRDGKSIDAELSVEEKKVVAKATRIKG